MLIRTLIVAASLAMGGCSTLSEYGSYGREALKNEQGHVIGHKQMLRHARTGEVIAQVALYTPFLNESGEVVGYEERVRDGTIIRNFDGHSIGGRFTDLRSRLTNSKSKGLTIVFRPQDAVQVAAVQPAVQPTVTGVMQLMASLSASDLRRIQ